MIILAAALAAAAATQTPLEVTPVRVAFAGEPTAPSVVADPGGGFVVSWTDKKTSSVNFAMWRDGRWFQPRTITAGKTLAVNRATFPVVAEAPGGLMFAAWQEKVGGHGRQVRLARSSNGGATWSAPVMPHPNLVSEFGFASIEPAKDGSLHAVWLDGRELKGGMEGNGDMQLRYSSVDAAGKASDVLLDPRVCDCCQTAMAMTDAGPVVAYRDRSAKEVRDISVVRWTAKGWSAPKTVHADGWELRGCPVNGPQLDASGRDVVIAWFTGAQGKARVNAAFSSDGGATWSAPVRVDGGGATGHVDVGLLADGSAVVTWTAGKELLARRVVRRGNASAPVTVAKQVVGVPRLAVSNDNVAVAWSTEKSIEMATLKVRP
ncbi:MAG TPA: sialidase family protein [Thermoanaerobaculia bacterium]|nr:sialidase family protein [Thermoanaerobaculia bacterium]